MKRLITPLALLMGLSLGAQAAPYGGIDPAASRIQFNYAQMGVSMSGEFKRFAAQLTLDPSAPEQAQGQLNIDLASIDTGSSEANQEVVGPAWFHTAAHPQAQFVLSRLTPQGPGRFQAQGQLRIKGQTRALQAPVQLSPEGLLRGELVIQRADFGIGEGMWSAFDIVANPVTVQFTLQLK